MSTAALRQTSYEASPVKRKRRSKAEMDRLESEIYRLADENKPSTVRQLFYRAVAAGLIDKTQAEYNNVAVRLTGKMREENRLPFAWLVDNTRWMRKPDSYPNLESALRWTAETYRRDLWRRQNVYVEIWCESDSIAGVLYPATEEWDVPLMPCGGQPSKSFVYSAAKSLSHRNRPSYVYYFGDYDKSGLDISDRIERDLRRYLPDGYDFTFERVAINEEQIKRYDLPTRPPKATRGNAKNVVDQTVELEAMSTADLQRLVRECIEQHVNQRVLEQTQAVEAAERHTLQMILANLEGAV